jgi:rubrerythrin
MNDEIFEEFDNVLDLIDCGKLPSTAISRMAYFGHTCIASIHLANRHFCCVKCNHQWNVKEDQEAEVYVYADSTCPLCHSKDEVYDITDKSQARWQCVECKHEWRSSNGYVCPSCKAEKDVPNYSCKSCNHKWKSVESPINCPECKVGL